MNNTSLKEFYSSVYKKGEENWYTKFKGGKNISENNDVILRLTDFTEKTVLDVGCGTGSLARRIGVSGASKVYGIDYALSAIEVAKSKENPPNVYFQNMNVEEWKEEVDILISCGTLEHMDKPWEVLKKFSQWTKPGGEVIISCPHFFNLRGFLWVGLQKLLDVPMSLSDLHSIAPFDIQKWIKDTDLEIVKIETFDHDLANSAHAVVDMKKRLTNALRDAEMPNDKVDHYLEWMNNIVEYMKSDHSTLQLEGGNALYYMKKAV